MNYSEKLKNPKWQKKRLLIMQRDNFKCCLCGEEHKHLTVHHLYYLPDCDPWEYDNEALVTLCYDCHDFAHSSLAKICSLIAFQVLKKRIDIIEIEEALKNI